MGDVWSSRGLPSDGINPPFEGEEIGCKAARSPVKKGRKPLPPKPGKSCGNQGPD